MSDLTDFLLARIAEDFLAADLVLRPYGDRAATNDAHWWIDDREWYRMGLSSDETPLLTRYTPQRVLAECEAKRRIVDWHPLVSGTGRDGEPVTGCANCVGVEEGQSFTIAGPCVTLRLLASVYSDHPDFRPEWESV